MAGQIKPLFRKYYDNEEKIMTLPVWETLYRRNILFCAAGDAVPLYGKKTEDEAALERSLRDRDVLPEAADSLVARIRPEWFPSGAAIDLPFLLARLAETEAEHGASITCRTDSADIKRLAALSRVKLQGTDGMRGRTSAGELSAQDSLELFIREGVISPALFKLTAEALGSEALENGLVCRGSSVLVGADGRDLSGRFAASIADGFETLGYAVLDAGIVPTPGVPLYAWYADCPLAAIVTASHNPSNQNGIKYLYRSFKLSDDGECGEFGLTARMFKIADGDALAGRSAVPRRDVHAEAIMLLEHIDVDNSGLRPGQLDHIRIVYDGANGAYSSLACRVLKDLGADFRAVNVDPRGWNINQGGGVGEIEGHAWFSARPEDGPVSNLKTIKAMFEEGRNCGPQKKVFGIVNDGDGDRGYLLVYSSAEDRVYVVPGDEVAFWIARGRRDSGDLGSDPVCVNSVESDIGAGYSMRRMLGIESETACVGDKNLLKPAKEHRNHIVGCEESGHVTFGVKVVRADGAAGMVYTGNGLLSVLRAISVIEGCHASLAETIHPFPSGTKDCRYVYFVDKGRFYRDSPVWKKDRETVLAALDSALPSDCSVRQVDFEDDPQMLYIACLNADGLRTASLFIRNSGTELKNCVTIRCASGLAPVFEAAMLKVNRLNRGLLKNEGLRDAKAEKLLLGKLREGPAARTDLKPLVESALGTSYSDTDFDALLFAMRKEKLIVEDNGEYSLSAEAAQEA